MAPSIEKPKRPLSAYNIFFQLERARIVNQLEDECREQNKSRTKVGFASLARQVAARWKCTSAHERIYYENIAADDKNRYKQEMDEWRLSTSRLSSEDEKMPPPKVTSPGTISGGCELSRFSANNGIPKSLGPDIFDGVYNREYMQPAIESFNDHCFDTYMHPSPICDTFDMVSSTPMQKTTIPHISDLAAKLDDECLNALSSFSFM